MIEKLLYLNFELWQPRGFFTSIWMEGNQEIFLPRDLGKLRGISISILNCGVQRTSLPRSEWKVTKGLLYLEPGAIKRLFYLNLELWWPRGFSTLIWMEGNQGASLPQNLGLLRGFFISILNYSDQGAYLPRSEWKVTNGLLYLRIRGNWEASLSQSWTVATKGLRYLDLNER